MLPPGRPSVVCAKSPNWKGIQAQCHKLKLDFQVGSGRRSPPSPGADSTTPNTIRPAFNAGQLHQVEIPHSPAEEMRLRLSQCLHTDHGAMSKAVAVCSFCLSWIQTQFLHCIPSHPAPPPALCISPSVHLHLSVVPWLPCCAHRKGPGDTPAVWHPPFPSHPLLPPTWVPWQHFGCV